MSLSMNIHALVLCALMGVLTQRASGDVSFASSKVHFASAADARRLLTTKDDFVRRLSPFDRAARLKTDRAVSEDEFLGFVGKAARDWTDAEMQAVTEAFEAIQPTARTMALSLPPVIQMVKTSGDEEGNAFYTRGTAIMLPAGELAKEQQGLKKIIAHELFHILSRQNPGLRAKLYGIIGFSACDEIKLPPELARRKITNPDAPRNDHRIQVNLDGTEHAAVPILLSSTERYDPARGGEFFNYLQLKLLLVKRAAGSKKVELLVKDGAPQLVDVQQVTGFFEQIGRNTSYIIHPEEILAENFALLVLGEQNVRSPDILQKMKQVLTR